MAMTTEAMLTEEELELLTTRCGLIRCERCRQIANYKGIAGQAEGRVEINGVITPVQIPIPNDALCEGCLKTVPVRILGIPSSDSHINRSSVECNCATKVATRLRCSTRSLCCGPQIRLAFLPTGEGFVIPASPAPIAPLRSGSGYRVSESLPELIPFNQQVHQVLSAARPRPTKSCSEQKRSPRHR